MISIHHILWYNFDGGWDYLYQWWVHLVVFTVCVLHQGLQVCKANSSSLIVVITFSEQQVVHIQHSHSLGIESICTKFMNHMSFRLLRSRRGRKTCFIHRFWLSLLRSLGSLRGLRSLRCMCSSLIHTGTMPLTLISRSWDLFKREHAQVWHMVYGLKMPRSKGLNESSFTNYRNV